MRGLKDLRTTWGGDMELPQEMAGDLHRWRVALTRWHLTCVQGPCLSS